VSPLVWGGGAGAPPPPPLSVGTAQALAPLRAISATSIYATSLLVEAVKVAKERCHSPMQSTKIVDYQNLIF